MTVNARDLPEARLRRWGIHALLGLAFLTSVWWAWGAYSRAWELESLRESARGRIPALEEAADQVASQCGLAPFSDRESLKTFPMEIGRYPTRRERECGEKVTKARADLIETYLELDRLRPLIVKARAGTEPTIPVVLLLGALLGIWLWFSEIRHRRGSP